MRGGRGSWQYHCSSFNTPCSILSSWQNLSMSMISVSLPVPVCFYKIRWEDSSTVTSRMSSSKLIFAVTYVLRANEERDSSVDGTKNIGTSFEIAEITPDCPRFKKKVSSSSTRTKKRDAAHHSPTHTSWPQLRISSCNSELLATATAILSYFIKLKIVTNMSCVSSIDWMVESIDSRGGSTYLFWGFLHLFFFWGFFVS